MAKKAANADDLTLRLIGRVKQARAEIASLSRPNWQTNGAFSYADNATVNLRVETDVKRLGMVVAFLIFMEESYGKAQDLVGKLPEFSWQGKTVDSWASDVRTRMAVLKLEEKKKELADLQTQLDSVISPELRRQMVLDEVSSRLDA